MLCSNVFMLYCAEQKRAISLTYPQVFWLILGITFVGMIGKLVQYIKSSYLHQDGSKYTGSYCARSMLDDDGLSFVKVEKRNKARSKFKASTNTLYLASSDFMSHSINSICASMYESAKITQYKNGYALAKLRRFFSKFFYLTDRIYFPIMLVGMIISIYNKSVGDIVFYSAASLFAMSIIYMLLTLRVESQALTKIKNHILNYDICEQNKNMQVDKMLKIIWRSYIFTCLFAAFHFLKYILIAIIYILDNKD